MERESTGKTTWFQHYSRQRPAGVCPLDGDTVYRNIQSHRGRIIREKNAGSSFRTIFGLNLL